MADLRKVARAKARKYGLDPNIFVRQIGAESGWNPRAVSPAGARGIAQIMPDTAKGWGVDPMNPVAALDAAAKNMARYVKQYGSYENALRAYNAGPGAIEKSKGYAETNSYVKKILGGRDPKRLGSPRRGGSQNPGTPAEDPGTAAFDPGAAAPLSLVLSTLSSQQPRPVASTSIAPPEFAAGPRLAGGQVQSGWQPPAPATGLDDMLAALRDQGQTLPQTEPSQGPQSKPARSSNRVSAKNLPDGQIAEVFYDPGINVDEGKRVGAIGGHGSHVHVGGDPALMVALGKVAQKMGLAVRENAAFDKVDPVHTKGSHHYRHGGRGAIDVSGDPNKLKAFNRRVARLAQR